MRAPGDDGKEHRAGGGATASKQNKQQYSTARQLRTQLDAHMYREVSTLAGPQPAPLHAQQAASRSLDDARRGGARCCIRCRRRRVGGFGHSICQACLHLCAGRTVGL